MRQLVMLGLLVMCRSYCSAAVALPPEVGNIALGITKDELLAARPAIKRKGWLGEELDLKRKDLVLYEDVKSSGSIYSTITYSIENDQLKSLGLSGYPKNGEERLTRKRAIRDARARWGKAKRKQVSEDSIRRGKGMAAFIWEQDGHEIILQLPVNRAKNDRRVSPVSILVRPIVAKNKPLRELSLGQAEKNRILKDNDADDMEAPQ